MSAVFTLNYIFSHWTKSQGQHASNFYNGTVFFLIIDVIILSYIVYKHTDWRQHYVSVVLLLLFRLKKNLSSINASTGW